MIAKYSLKMIPNIGIVLAVLETKISNGHIVIGEGSCIFEVDASL
jgi:DNA-directed RNA polymerase subunit E'/Rpb7